MKTHIGVAGPYDAIQSVIEVAKEFEDRIHLHTFIYSNFDELIQILETQKDVADIWVFTGITAYQMTVHSNFIKGKLLIQTGGSSLMKQLYQISRDNLNPERISIDTLLEGDCRETFLELGLSTEHLYTLPSSDAIPKSDWVQFHESLYAEKKVEACITHHIYVYHELQKRNIPVYRLMPTRMSIRQALHLASQQGQTNYFRKSQIAVVIIALKDSTNKNSHYYESYRLKLKIEDSILKYAESVSGTLVPLGLYRFMITTARGAVEQCPDHPPINLLNEIKLLTNLEVYCGIGYGINGRGAEQNASLSLSHAEKNGDGSAMITDERGNITNTFSDKESFVFNYRSEDTELIEKLKEEGISIVTYNKLIYVQKNLDKQSLSAVDVAEWLNMSYRSANRILLGLERCGLIQVIGEESPSTKGRPRKLYRIQADES